MNNRPNEINPNSETSKPKFEVSSTAKLAIAVKYVTAQPSFWKNREWGDRETPLSKNDCSKIFLTDEDIQKAENRPDIRNSKTVSTRERWINKIFENHVKEKNCKQVIILGSGFDIRPFKKNPDHQNGKKHAETYAQVKYWEIDKKEVLDAKEQIFIDKGLDKNANYIKMDYTKENFIDELRSTGIQFDLPTLIIWEGNLMYLEKNQAINVINELKSSFTEFTIVFDYLSQSFIDKIGSPYNTMFKTGIDNIEEFAKEQGLIMANKGNMSDLEIEYKVDKNPDQKNESYHLCALRK